MYDLLFNSLHSIISPFLMSTGVWMMICSPGEVRLATRYLRPGERAGCLNNFFFPNQHDHNPSRTKAWISISKEKGECPLHAPLSLLLPLSTVLVTLVTPWAECRSGGPTKQPLVSPHNSPWWWLTLLFMERAGGSDNTLQIIAHPRSPLSSYSLTPSALIFCLSSF